MKPTKIINLTYAFAALLIVAGAIIRIFHYFGENTGFYFMLAGFLSGTFTDKLYINYLNKKLSKSEPSENI